MLHACQASRCDGHWHGYFLTNHGGGCTATFHVDCHTLAQLDFLEITFVGAVSAFCPRAAVGIVVEHTGDALFCQQTQLFNGGDHGHF